MRVVDFTVAPLVLPDFSFLPSTAHSAIDSIDTSQSHLLLSSFSPALLLLQDLVPERLLPYVSDFLLFSDEEDF